ncbi:MAG: hypothetical protein WCO29_14140 [Nostocales cyanobacterium ELA583]
MFHANVGWVVRVNVAEQWNKTQRLPTFVGLRYRLTQPTDLLKVK